MLTSRRCSDQCQAKACLTRSISQGSVHCAVADLGWLCISATTPYAMQPRIEVGTKIRAWSIEFVRMLPRNVWSKDWILNPLHEVQDTTRPMVCRCFPNARWHSMSNCLSAVSRARKPARPLATVALRKNQLWARDLHAELSLGPTAWPAPIVPIQGPYGSCTRRGGSKLWAFPKVTARFT